MRHPQPPLQKKSFSLLGPEVSQRVSRVPPTKGCPKECPQSGLGCPEHSRDTPGTPCGTLHWRIFVAHFTGRPGLKGRRDFCTGSLVSQDTAQELLRCNLQLTSPGVKFIQCETPTWGAPNLYSTVCGQGALRRQVEQQRACMTICDRIKLTGCTYFVHCT